MSRETKKDRILRTVVDQVLESIHQFKSLVSNPNTKESDLERWCEGVIRSCLGFTATNGYTIRAQETKGKGRPDLIVYKDEKPILVVEVKKLGFDLDKSDFRSGKIQLSEYLHSLGNVRWGILCNGFEWKLFDFSVEARGGVEVVSFDFRSEGEEIETSKRAVDDLTWEFIDLHEYNLKEENWDELAREATAFSPESLAKAMLSLNVVKAVAKEIRGEHDYKVNTEVLFDKVADVLKKGMDDSIVGWNEVKELEINKYVNSQKKSARKKRRATKGEVQQDTTTTVATNTTTTMATTTNGDGNTGSAPPAAA